MYGLEFPEQAEVCLLFEECSWSQRENEGRGLVHMVKLLQGNRNPAVSESLNRLQRFSL